MNTKTAGAIHAIQKYAGIHPALAKMLAGGAIGGAAGAGTEYLSNDNANLQSMLTHGGVGAGLGAGAGLLHHLGQRSGHSAGKTLGITEGTAAGHAVAKAEHAKDIAMYQSEALSHALSPEVLAKLLGARG